MDFDACYQLGHVIKAQGLKGEVKVFLDVDDPGKYNQLESVLIDLNDDKELVPFFIDRVSLQNNHATLKLEDIDTVEQAEELKNKKLYLPLSMLEPLDGDQFYFHEIKNFQVIDMQEGELGLVREVYAMPNQDLIAMDYAGKEVLIPINGHIVKSVNRADQTMTVSLPDGLLALYLED